MKSHEFYLIDALYLKLHWERFSYRYMVYLPYLISYVFALYVWTGRSKLKLENEMQTDSQISVTELCSESNIMFCSLASLWYHASHHSWASIQKRGADRLKVTGFLVAAVKIIPKNDPLPYSLLIISV